MHDMKRLLPSCLLLLFSYPVLAAGPDGSTVARIAFWVAPSERQTFAAAFNARLLPLLQGHGLTLAREAAPATPDNIYSRLVLGGSPQQLPEIARALAADDAWRAALQQLGCTRIRLEPYRTPAGPGHSLRAGPGLTRGSWQTYSVRDGLPSANVNRILVDRSGTLWFGTDGGLTRFDGEGFTTFTTEDGLVSNRVQALLEDRDGNLWIGTGNHQEPGQGVSRYDGESFTTVSTADGLADNSVQSLAQDRHGHIWFGGGTWRLPGKGLSRYDGVGIARFDTVDGLPGNTVRAILEDAAGHLWFATGHEGAGVGVARFDGERFESVAHEDGVPHGVRSALFEAPDGRLWVGGTTGLSWLAEGRFRHARGAAEERFEVRAILQDRRGRQCVALFAEGITCFGTGVTERFRAVDGLPNDQVYDLVADDNGDLWAATYGGGVGRYLGNRVRSYRSAQNLALDWPRGGSVDRHGELWFGGHGGVARFDGDDLTAVARATGFPEANVDAILEDSQGRRWFGTRGRGVARYDGETLEVLSEPGLQMVDDMVEDRHGRIWFATGWGKAGVWRFDDGALTSWTTEDGLANDSVWDIEETADGDLWFATEGGVSRYDGEGFTNYTQADGLSDDLVWSLFQDRGGVLWAGSEVALHRFDGERFTAVVVDGLTSPNRVLAIDQDAGGALRLGLYGRGVMRYDGLVAQTISRQDGLLSDGVQLILQDRDGDDWILADGGIVRYRRATMPPGVRVREIIADQSYRPEGDIRLSSRQDFVRFEYQGSSLSTSPDRFVYVHRLVGLDSTWRPTRETLVEYHDLPIGDYAFQVRAVDVDLNYSTMAVVPLTITPAYGLLSLTVGLGAALLALVIVGRTAARRRQERDVARSELIEERQQRIQVQAHEIEAWRVQDFVGRSAAMGSVLEQVRALSANSDCVLIEGEQGTGKELVARAIHAGSERASQAFVPVRCAGLPRDVEALTERTRALSMLFGHVQGAFSGADDDVTGLLRQAQGGTLLLDEVGMLALPLQAHLLRVLQARSVRPMGGTAEALDIRVLASTSEDLKLQVQVGRFHLELYDYLTAQLVFVPSLRERAEDIGPLVQQLADSICNEQGWEVMPLPAELLPQLQSGSYPGNVRQLRRELLQQMRESRAGG